jgi:hypothetical protein
MVVGVEQAVKVNTGVIPAFIAGTHGAKSLVSELVARWVPGTSPGMTLNVWLACRHNKKWQLTQ